MADKVLQGVLRGFDIAIANVGDRVRLCRPLLSLDGDPQTVYIAGGSAWPDALVPTDISEAEELATVLPQQYQRGIRPSQGVAVAGSGFVRAAEDAHLDLPSMCPVEIDSGCRIGLATVAEYDDFKDDLAAKAMTVFDEELERAVREWTSLSARGRAAILILRKCGPRDEGLAMRQLASARQDYERLLIGFARELGISDENLHRRVLRYAAFAPSIVDQITRADDALGRSDRSLEKADRQRGLRENPHSTVIDMMPAMVQMKTKTRRPVDEQSVVKGIVEHDPANANRKVATI